MARNIFFILAALVAQECSAVPVVLPSSLFPSLTLTGIALPTGARLDVHHHSLPFSLPPLPTGGAEVKREEGPSLPTGLPSLSVPIVSLTDISSLIPLPTGGVDIKREEDLPLPADLLSLTISLPSLSATFTLPSLSTTLSLPSLTSIPALPSLTTTPALPSLTISLEHKRQEFSSDIPQSIATLSEPTGSSLIPRREDPTATPSVPIATATGLPTGLLTPPALPTGIPTGVPTGAPTGLPPAPSGLRVVPGGLLRPGRV